MMIYGLLALCVGCYVGQIFFNRMFSGSYVGDGAVASPVFAGIYGIVVAGISFCLNGFQASPSTLTWILGIGNGVVLFLYNLGMIQAARRGPYSFQSIVMLFGCCGLSLVISLLLWKETLPFGKLVGFLVMLVAFVALNGGVALGEVQKGYFFWVAVVFFTNGLYSVLMDAQQRLLPAERNEMILVTFGASALVSLGYLLVLRRGKAWQAFCMGRRALGFALTSSVCAAFAVYLLMLLLGYIPSYILYTINNGSILVLNCLLCAVVLHERISRLMGVGILLSVLSIVLLSI